VEFDRAGSRQDRVGTTVREGPMHDLRYRYSLADLLDETAIDVEANRP